MDVTSLLNSGSGVIVERRDSMDQAHTPSVVDGTTPSTTPFPTPSPEKTPSRRSSESRARGGGRTPWDAGGYSLPLSLDTKNLQMNSRPSFYFSDSPIEATNSASPKSPRHKCSDSQSSLSSYTSSANSVSHSRISSLSTVSEFQPLSNILTDFSSAEKISDPVSAVSCPPTMIEVSPPSPVLEESSSRLGNDDDGSQLESDHGSAGTLHRPQSPSDAIMITRLQGEERRGSQDSIGTVFKTSNNFLSPDQVQTKSHKRAVSAPDIPVLGTSPYVVTKHGLDTMADQENTGNKPNMDEYAKADASEHIDPVVESDTPPFTEKDKKCLFMENCDTGSTLRKAISHIFGRNKLCTRSIPEEVWVHYCRKHYQRSRYRNIKEWVVRCAELVAKQVQQIDDWSRWNAAHNKEGGVVTGWNITVRKREQKRLQDIGKKRALPVDDDEDAFDEATDTADLTGTAVPPWIHQYMNKSLPTSEVQKIVARLHQELKDDTAAAMPDIEILPEIDTTKTARARAAPRASNRRVGAAHKRSQSMGQPLGYGNHHVEKRPRISFHDSSMMQSSYSPYTISPIGQHPRFPDFSPYSGAQHPHVNTPTSQRPVGAPSMSHLENTSSFYQGGASYEGRKMSHQRSHSEVPVSYRPSPISQDYQLPSIAKVDNLNYYSRPPQHDLSFRPGGPSLYPTHPTPRDSRPSYAQSSGYVPSYSNAASQPSYAYPQYPTSSAASPSQAYGTSMSPPSSTIRPLMGSDTGATHPGVNAAGSRHIRHQSSPAISRAGTFQPMGQGISSANSMVLPHHPAGPWAQGPSRSDSEQSHYANYTIPEADREPSYGGPRYS